MPYRDFECAQRALRTERPESEEQASDDKFPIAQLVQSPSIILLCIVAIIFSNIAQVHIPVMMMMILPFLVA